jgi:hypothetical protein
MRRSSLTANAAGARAECSGRRLQVIRQLERSIYGKTCVCCECNVPLNLWKGQALEAFAWLI